MKKHLFVNKGIIVVALILTAVMAYACSVESDIKPGSAQNKINPGSHGKVKVAILASPSFDVTSVCISTVRFGKLGRSEGASVESYSYLDVDNDGDLDLVCQFNVDETGIDYGDTSASIVGNTDLGESFNSEDMIQTVGNP
ncbi:hypothetical protein AYK25_07485 [Thermoplasmatales archaeon SM1-50]|nr:MAG: hypothetical protein AYK25_07485 [Thermoplasmatales archaeon SM1-50]